MTKKNLSPLSARAIKEGRRVDKEIAAGKPWDSIKGLEKVDLRRFRPTKVSKATRERQGMT